MDPREMETLVQRLVHNPHDQDALAYAHQAGQADPRSYAMLLEKVGTATADPAFASHWLTEAANVWSLSLSDAHRAARALMIAIDRDPTQSVPAERLAELYREKGDTKALVALLERRAKALATLAQQDPELQRQAAAIHQELGQLWAEPPLSQPKKALENYRKAVEYDAHNQYAIYALRELYKAQGAWSDAIPLFGLELALVEDPERRMALLHDEAEVRRSASDLSGATQCLRSAREIEGGTDATLKQQVAALVLERMQGQLELAAGEREEATELFVELSEEYPGDHGFSYALCALELSPSHDRAVQLAIYYGEQLGRVNEVAAQAAAYLRANPQGPLVPEARRVVTQAMELGGDVSLLEALGPAPGAELHEQVASLLEIAQALARKAKKNEAAQKFREVLALDPDNADAIGFLEGHYRQTRKFAELKDMLLAAGRCDDADVDQRRSWLKEAATVCESQLRDPNLAISALKESVALDPEDETARNQLKRLLEKSGQWDLLAELLTQEAEQIGDAEARILLEKSLAKLHEQKRKDPIATGETWARIASLSPDDEEAILTAVSHFEQAERADLAARVIADNLEAISNDQTRGSLLEKLGTLRAGAGDALLAGEAFAEAGGLLKSEKLWSLAEESFVKAAAWDQAASAVDERARLARSDKEKAKLYALEADYLLRAGDESSSVLRLEQATDLDPLNEDFANRLEARFEEASRREDLAAFLLKRAERVSERELRVGLRKRAATLQRDALSDLDAARATLVLLLDDGDDAEALLWLAEDAQQSGEPRAAAEYYARLVKVEADPEKKVKYALAEAALVADGLDDPQGAIARYGRILSDLDPKRADAWERIADLNDRLDRPRAAADALEKRLPLLSEPEQKLATAERLAALYEGPLDEPSSAIRVLDVIRSLEPENFDAVQRLAELCERVEDWPRVAELTAILIDVEGDEDEVSRMTRRLAEILHKKVGKGDDALAALMAIADRGDEACRTEYVRLGDELGWKGIVASKLVEWYIDVPIGADRNTALRGAFDRFLEVGRKSDAASVAKELARSRGADADLASKLESIAIELKDLEALQVAHDLLVQPLTGPSRCEELVRQAEVLVSSGVDPGEAIQRGELALTSVPAGDVWPLLARLAKLASDPTSVVDIYERQVTRARAPGDRLEALARAAQVSARHGELQRARQFLDVALGGSIQEDTVTVLEQAAREFDAEQSGDRLRRLLAEALSAGGQGSRDGGRTRSSLLGRAAQIAYRDLNDTNQAFAWLGDAIVAHVDDERLASLETLAQEVGEPKRAETVLTRALEEVFDGPLVRKLLARRAGLRRRLEDPVGAAQDLKRLHDLSPSDLAVMEQLSALYTELKDYRGMVQLYEDQILRGKDPTARAELARKVARLWEQELDDPREAADAWRRVLRMKAGDVEAVEGLERAKSNMLKRKAEPNSDPEAASPSVKLEREKPVKRDSIPLPPPPVGGLGAREGSDPLIGSSRPSVSESVAGNELEGDEPASDEAAGREATEAALVSPQASEQSSADPGPSTPGSGSTDQGSTDQGSADQSSIGFDSGTSGTDDGLTASAAALEPFSSNDEATAPGGPLHQVSAMNFEKTPAVAVDLAKQPEIRAELGALGLGALAEGERAGGAMALVVPAVSEAAEAEAAAAAGVEEPVLPQAAEAEPAPASPPPSEPFAVKPSEVPRQGPPPKPSRRPAPEQSVSVGAGGGTPSRPLPPPPRGRSAPPPPPGGSRPAPPPLPSARPGGARPPLPPPGLRRPPNDTISQTARANEDEEFSVDDDELIEDGTA